MCTTRCSTHKQAQFARASPQPGRPRCPRATIKNNQHVSGRLRGLMLSPISIGPAGVSAAPVVQVIVTPRTNEEQHRSHCTLRMPRLRLCPRAGTSRLYPCLGSLVMLISCACIYPVLTSVARLPCLAAQVLPSPQDQTCNLSNNHAPMTPSCHSLPRLNTQWTSMAV
jgi:hypothetical protein